MSIKGNARESILLLLLLLVVFNTNATSTTIAEDSISGVVNEWKRHHLRSGDDASHSDRQLKRPSKKHPASSPSQSPTASPTAAPTMSREQEWELNKAKWNCFISGGSNARPYNGYEMVFQKQSQVVDYGLPYRVTVNKDDKVFLVRQMDGTPVNDDGIIDWMRTVDEVFQVIADSWTNNADSVAVTYDAEKGHPTDCNIDQDSGAADDEIIIKILNATLR
ncbi:hypothetical protein ACHAWU_004423 [Discostella pseudostelligera]|uniref:Uncharacterized protein n=1 Tax=Discostella pseudostelligera TaxID=259834 RepID=A0ABD3N714_9STRA